MVHSRSRILTALLLTILLSASVDALEVVNKRACTLTVFVPPICAPCSCPAVVCKKAPCPKPSCFCTLECRFVPGVDVKPGEATTIPVRGEDFPLAFLTVEFQGSAYNVGAEDLKCVTKIATVVVTEEKCGTMGVVARVFSNPKFAGSKEICLESGERYGS